MLTRIIIFALLLLTLSGCAPAPAAPPATAVPTATPDPPDKILFIGNSLTFWNDGVYNHLEQLAASANPPQVITADKTTMGGATLETLWELSAARNYIGKGLYDVVVLQEDIPEADPATGVDTFHQYVRQFDAEIKKAGARPVLFMAWSYLNEQADERLRWITMAEIAQAHRDIATELSLDVAPVGLAFQRAMQERPDLDMYDSDGEHPSIYGTYLATSVIYATVFGESPVGLPYLPPEGFYMLSNGGNTPGITEEEAAFLQRIAWETVQGYQAQQE